MQFKYTAIIKYSSIIHAEIHFNEHIFILHADCAFYEYSKAMQCTIIIRWILELNYNKLMYITDSGESIQRKRGMENYQKTYYFKTLDTATIFK